MLVFIFARNFFKTYSKKKLISTSVTSSWRFKSFYYHYAW